MTPGNFEAMLFHSSLRRELARSFGATLLVLITIVLTILLVRTLGMANRGRVDPEEIALVLTYTVLAQFPAVLTMALFIAIISVCSRMYRDSEMMIWMTSGKGLGSFLAPLFRFAWPVIAVVGLMVMLVWPWANQQIDDLSNRYEKRGDLERVTPGQFQESASGKRVFFIDKDSTYGKVGTNVFVSDVDAKGKESITSARSGRVEWLDGGQFLLLNAGQRLDRDPAGKDGLRVSEFGEYGVLLNAKAAVLGERQSLWSVPTWVLWGSSSPYHRGELGWRIGFLLSAINFVFFALAVSIGNPRAGRSANLAFALLAYIVYNNLLNVGKGWVGAGQIDLPRLLLMLHGGVLLFSLAWIAKRHFNWRLLPAWRPLLASRGGQP